MISEIFSKIKDTFIWFYETFLNDAVYRQMVISYTKTIINLILFIFIAVVIYFYNSLLIRAITIGLAFFIYMYVEDIIIFILKKIDKIYLKITYN